MKVLKASLSLALAVILLFSLSGVSIYKHYCGDYLVEFSFYTPADNCSDEDDDSCETSKMDCCSDEEEHYTADIDLIKENTQKFQLVPNFFVVSNSVEIESAKEIDRYPKCAYISPNIHAPPIYLELNQLTYYG